jgi:hypothetical protein
MDPFLSLGPANPVVAVSVENVRNTWQMSVQVQTDEYGVRLEAES